MNKSENMGHIKELVDKISLYLDPGKYTFDSVKVERLLMEAEQTVEQTARGVRPKDLPEDIPFSDSLDEEGKSGPYTYAGDMSPEDYDRMMESFERDQRGDENRIPDASDDDSRVITVYQSPDRRHCALLPIENNGEFNDTGMPGIRYFLPDGFHVQYRYGHPSNILDSKGNDAYLVNRETGEPQLCGISSKTGRISSVGIFLRPYSERPEELWDEYNTMLQTINSNYKLGRTGTEHNKSIMKLAVTDCRKIIDNLYGGYVQNPNDKNLKDEIAAKYEQLKWLEKEKACLDLTDNRDTLKDRINTSASKTSAEPEEEQTRSFGEMQL